MKVSTEQFNEVKQFAIHHNIESFLTSLDAPMGEFSFNQLNKIPVGERFPTVCCKKAQA